MEKVHFYTGNPYKAVNYVAYRQGYWEKGSLYKNKNIPHPFTYNYVPSPITYRYIRVPSIKIKTLYDISISPALLSYFFKGEVYLSIPSNSLSCL